MPQTCLLFAFNVFWSSYTSLGNIAELAGSTTGPYRTTKKWERHGVGQTASNRHLLRLDTTASVTKKVSCLLEWIWNAYMLITKRKIVTMRCIAEVDRRGGAEKLGHGLHDHAWERRWLHRSINNSALVVHVSERHNQEERYPYVSKEALRETPGNGFI